MADEQVLKFAKALCRTTVPADLKQKCQLMPLKELAFLLGLSASEIAQIHESRGCQTVMEGDYVAIMLQNFLIMVNCFGTRIASNK
jgi:hypothetical protein